MVFWRGIWRDLWGHLRGVGRWLGRASGERLAEFREKSGGRDRQDRRVWVDLGWSGAAYDEKQIAIYSLGTPKMTRTLLACSNGRKNNRAKITVERRQKSSKGCRKESAGLLKCPQKGPLTSKDHKMAQKICPRRLKHVGKAPEDPQRAPLSSQEAVKSAPKGSPGSQMATKKTPEARPGASITALQTQSFRPTPPWGQLSSTIWPQLGVQNTSLNHPKK